jgi:hypothetical protein
MHVVRAVGVAVMRAVMRRPPQHPLLTRRLRDDRQHELRQPSELERAVTEIAVVPGSDPEHPDEITSGQPRHERPTERNGENGERRQVQRQEPGRLPDLAPAVFPSRHGVTLFKRRDLVNAS